MKLHRSIFTQLFPYQSGEENAPTAPAFPAPAGAMRATEQSVEEKPQDMFDRTKSPIRHPDQRLDPAMAMNETVVTPTAEQSITIDENAPAPEYPQPMNTPPVETTQLERLRPGDRDPVLVERMAELRRAPMDNMELGGATTATYAPTAPMTSVPMPLGIPSMMPGDKGKKEKKTSKSDYVDPYPDPQNPQEVAANALARMKEQERNPINKDKGAKGLALELLENFLYGLGKTPAGASVGQALLLGGTGAGAGFINKGWNEQRAAEAAIPELENDVQRTGQMVNQKFARDDKTRDNVRQDANLKRQQDRDAAQIADWARRADQRDFKMVTDAQLEAMRDEWVRTRDTKRLQLTEAEMKNRMDRADADRASREKLKGMSEAGATGHTQVTAANRSKVAALSSAVQMYKADPTPENQEKVRKAQDALK